MLRVLQLVGWLLTLSTSTVARNQQRLVTKLADHNVVRMSERRRQLLANYRLPYPFPALTDTGRRLRLNLLTPYHTANQCISCIVHYLHVSCRPRNSLRAVHITRGHARISASVHNVETCKIFIEDDKISSRKRVSYQTMLIFKTFCNNW